MVPFWKSTTDSQLAQDDYLPDCLVPIVPSTFGPESQTTDLTIHTVDLVILTQSCDLARGKHLLVSLCPIHSIKTFEATNPAFGRKGAWEDVRKGRREGLHLLASPLDPD